MLLDPLLPPPQPPIEISAIQNAITPNARMLFLMTLIPLPLWRGEVPLAIPSSPSLFRIRATDLRRDSFRALNRRIF